MNTIALLSDPQVDEKHKLQNFFPRIIREFEDNDEPMMYAERY